MLLLTASALLNRLQLQSGPIVHWWANEEGGHADAPQRMTASSLSPQPVWTLKRGRSAKKHARRAGRGKDAGTLLPPWIEWIQGRVGWFWAVAPGILAQPTLL